MASNLRVARDSSKRAARRIPWKVAALCAALCALPWATLRALPQDATTNATLKATGEIHTADGAPIPGATLRLTDQETQKVWISWSDESGRFEFPSLPPGHYKVEATQLGFQTTTIDLQIAGLPEPHIQLVLRVATLAELAAPAGSSGSQQQTGPPTRQAGANSGQNRPGQSANGDAGRRGRGQQLPPGLLNAVTQGMGGGFQQTDVTTDDAAGSQENAAAVPGAGGGAASSDSFLLQGTVGQGLAMNNPGAPGGFGDQGFGGPGGGGGNADFGVGQQIPGAGPGGPGGGPGGGRGGFAGGRGGGGPGGGGPGGGRLFRQQVNRVRFSLYDRYTNSILDGKPYSITGVQYPQIPTYNEQFGGNVGGPLKIPHIYDGSDHTYFFVNYAHIIQRVAVNSFSTVPTLDQRNGLFCLGTLGVPTLFEPFSSPPVPFPTVADANCPSGSAQQVPINSAAQGLLGYIPKPNLPGAVQNFLLQATTPSDSDAVNVHILHIINSKFNLNGTYNLNSVRANTLSNFPGIGGDQSTLAQSVNIGLTHNWSPRLVEDTHFIWSRNRVNLLSDNSYTTDIAANLGITGVSTAPIDFGIPSIGFSNLSGLNDPVPSLVRNQTSRFTEAFTWTHLKHTMRFGGEVRRIELNTNTSPNPRGQFTFTGLLTSALDASGNPISGTGNDFADFLIGFPYSTSEQFGMPNVYLRNWGFALYAQDDFRVRKTFSIQYGLRYDTATPLVELNNHLATLDLNPETLQVTLVTPGQDGFPRALVHGNYGNWEPRFGFAWQPPIKPKTVVRGGYSIFYNESIYSSLAQQLTYQNPFQTSQALIATSPVPLTLQVGFPASGMGDSTLPIPNTKAVSPAYKSPYAQIWTLGTETSFSQNWILDLTYTGTKGTNLDILRAPNRAPLGTPQDEIQENRIDPEAGGYTYDQSGANSIYNGLQVRVVHRFTHGFMIQGIYTYSKSLDDASSIGGTAATVEQIDGDVHAEYGLSTFDIRNQFRTVSMYELPFGQRSRWANHGWKARVFGDWRLQNIVTWQTGTPFTALLGGSASDNGTGANYSLRAEQDGNPNTGICGGSSTAFFKTSVFSVPPTVGGIPTYGNEQRGAIEGPCSFNWSLNFSKTYRFGPELRHMLNVSWQVQNVTNTPTFTGIGTTLVPSVGGGAVTPAGSFFGRVTSAGAMRSMNIMVRYNF
jgi:hypothetical protein